MPRTSTAKQTSGIFGRVGLPDRRSPVTTAHASTIASPMTKGSAPDRLFPDQPFVLRQNLEHFLLHAIVDGHDQLVPPLLGPSVNLIITFLKLDQHLFGGAEITSLDQIVEARPHIGKHIGRVVASPAVENRAGVDAVPH